MVPWISLRMGYSSGLSVGHCKSSSYCVQREQYPRQDVKETSVGITYNECTCIFVFILLLRFSTSKETVDTNLTKGLLEDQGDDEVIVGNAEPTVPRKIIKHGVFVHAIQVV
jgi:hypothetical protein